MTSELSPSDESATPLRVVVVDDAADIRLLLTLQFTRDPRFEVVGQGENGAEAIDLADRLRPDLMVLDRQMPVLGGLEAIDKVRAKSPTTAVILYTATSDEETQQAALGAGAVEVLEKTGTDFIAMLTAKLVERTSGNADSLELRVGPVAASAARVWIANTTRLLEAVGGHPEVVDVPPDVLEFFCTLIDQWQEIAAASEQFLWVARSPVEEVARIVEHWAVIDAMTDEQLERLGVHWSPPEGEPFFHALTAGVLRALESHQETRRLAARLTSQWGSPEG
jgi:CheY-like chemotaxis protein